MDMIKKTADRSYYAPHGGHPAQTQLLTDRAVFTEAYAVIPRGVMQDIVTSALPFWDGTRVWILSRPLSGFAETFSQYIVEVGPGGGSDRPEPDAGAEAALFVVEGELTVTLAGRKNVLRPGGFAYLPPASGWTVRNEDGAPARFHCMVGVAGGESALTEPACRAIGAEIREVGGPLVSREVAPGHLARGVRVR